MLQPGARDGYQVAWALQEAGLLDVLVTNGYSKRRPGILQRCAEIMPGVRAMAAQRRCPMLDDDLVVSRWDVELLSHIARKCGGRSGGVLSDGVENWLGRIAVSRARQRHADAILSYSYIAYPVFLKLQGSGILRILMQCHPHPRSVQRILMEEEKRHPELGPLLGMEREMSSGGRYVDQLSREPELADVIIVASTFTKTTLVENGICDSKITVVPYGTDSPRLHLDDGEIARARRERDGGSFRILFVGQFTQRKGLSYLIGACRSLDMSSTTLTLVGRGLDGLDVLFPNETPGWVRIRKCISDRELAIEYASADLLVLPSLAEGFGHVILEAMAYGLPVIATPNSGAPDVIRHGEGGYIVPCADARGLAAAIEELRAKPLLRSAMGLNSANAARRFTWERFRVKVADCVSAAIEGCFQPESGDDDIEAVTLKRHG